MGLKVGTVKIEKYNPNWELEFYMFFSFVL